MPVLDIDPGQSPEAPGTLSFYRQGQDPSTGFQVTADGVVSAPGGSTAPVSYTGAAADDAVAVRVTGDAQPRFVVNADGKAEWGDGTNAVDMNLYRDSAIRLHTQNTFVTEGDLECTTAGGGLNIREGSNARLGVATLVAGTVTVNTNQISANSRVFLTAQNTGGTPGALRISARVAGTSFTITSTSGTDTSQVAWMIVEPAA